MSTRLYPMGDRGGTATPLSTTEGIPVIIPDGRSGGNRNVNPDQSNPNPLYPMGDRGGTATNSTAYCIGDDYTRWEIGGEPQQFGNHSNPPFIIPDGRSGGNRNPHFEHMGFGSIIPDGRSGGNRNVICDVFPVEHIIPDGRSGGNRN